MDTNYSRAEQSIEHQTQLRSALRTNDYAKFEEIINEGKVDLEHVYQYPDYKSCLDLAVSEPRKERFVNILLQRGVNVNTVNIKHAAAPIHFAVESGNLEALRALLEVDNIDVNIKRKGNTALLLALKKIAELKHRQKHETSVYENMIELLLNKGCSPNTPDLEKNTPIYLASNLGIERVVVWILNSKDPVDLDDYEDRSRKSARKILLKKFPHIIAKLDPTFNISVEDMLYSYLRRDEEDHFIQEFTKLVYENGHWSAINTDDGCDTMLQLATERCLERAVVTLLTSGSDPYATCTGNSYQPIAIACKNGFLRILNKYVEHESILFDSIDGDSLLQITITGMRWYSKNPCSDHMSCIKVLFEHPNIKININQPDDKNNTALYYAAKYGYNDIILELLRRGAYVGSLNKYNIMPLAHINAETLETYLDGCITTFTKSNDKPSSDKNHEIYLTYNFLIYPKNLHKPSKSYLSDNTNNDVKELDPILAPETDVLLYIAENEELRQLLKHPIVTAFLDLKWKRINFIFFANFIIYSFFPCLFVLYILIHAYSGQFDSIMNIATWTGAIVGLIVLITRETFQIVFSHASYAKTKRNYSRIILIFLTAWILNVDSTQVDTQPLSAVAILLVSAELFVLVGHFPKMSNYIAMLKTVSINFIKFMAWYLLLIVAFAFSFYILFKRASDGNGDKEENFFEDPFKSIFKTFVMLTGEFDMSSIKFNNFPVISHIIFVVFIVMVPIVLLNLLNGLAVDDIKDVRSNAKLVSYIWLVENISYFEKIFIVDKSAESKLVNWPMFIKLAAAKIQNWKQKMLHGKRFAKQLCLFPYASTKYEIVIKPNNDNQVIILMNDNDYDIEMCVTDERSRNENSLERKTGLDAIKKYFISLCRNEYSLDKKILEDVNNVINKKKRIDAIIGYLKGLENKLDDIIQHLK